MPHGQQPVLKVYPLEGEFIASLELKEQQQQEGDANKKKKKPSQVETVIILDRSGSMGNSVYKIVHSVLPKFFELLAYDEDATIHLIAFESRTRLHTLRVRDFRAFKMRSAGGTSMSPAVEQLQRLFADTFEKSATTALRILTISDGEVWDQQETKSVGDRLAERASHLRIAVNSQAVRFFTSRAQPDTTALCSLLQLNNVRRSRLTDVDAHRHHDRIARDMADLFADDGFDDARVLACSDAIFYEFPWDERVVAQVTLFAGRTNVVWLDEVPTPAQTLTVDGEAVRVEVAGELSVEQFQLLLASKLDFVVDRMKILKVVDTASARLTIEKIVEYFGRVEAKMASVVADERLDPRLIENRARLLKLRAVRARKISTLLATIANDECVARLNAAQKAEYLRSVQASSRASRGLAKRAAKRVGAPVFGFDEIVRRQVRAMKAHFGEIADVEWRAHEVSFYSHATTVEGIRALVDFADDPSFDSFSAAELLQLLNLVGVACSGPVGDFPDASSWRVGQLFVGCYVSVADIVSALEQAGDSGLELKAPGFDAAITNVIPVFEDARIGVFLKRHAPALLEYTSSIGMRRVVADVPMTFGYTIIAGIRRLMYDLNKNRTSAHLHAFSQFVSTAAAFVGKYYDHIEELLVDADHGQMSFYLANNGISNMLVPLIRLYKKRKHEAMRSRMPAILRSIYSCEVWRGISRQFRSKQNFDAIVREMLHKLLSLDLEAHKVRVQQPFTAEPPREQLIFSDAYAVNQEYLDQLMQPLYYHNYMSLLPRLLHAAIHGPLDDIKDMPELTKTSAMEAFDVDFPYSQFAFLNAFQALRYPRSSARADTKQGRMTVVDVKHREAALEDVRRYVRQEFEALYDFEVKMKKRAEERTLAAELVAEMSAESSYARLLELWRDGVARGSVSYRLESSSSIAFKGLTQRVMDMRAKVPLRAEIIRILLLAVDSDGRAVFNGGKVADVKNVGRLKKRFLATRGADEWEEIERRVANKERHVYREKENRHGHGVGRPSYWAMGYATLLDYFSGLTDQDMSEYLSAHDRCCGSWHTSNLVWQMRWESEDRGRQELRSWEIEGEED